MNGNAPTPYAYPLSPTALVSILSLGFALACSGQSASGGGNKPANSAGSSSIGGSGQDITAGASSAAGNQDVAGGTGGASDPSNASGGVPASLMGGAAGAAGGDQCRDNVSAADWAANCLACAGGDTCAQCTCTKCADAVRTCETTPGCREIAACVRTNACTGAQCYCGTVNVLECANGSAANGPCKEVILNAPGGKAPTAADPSAGPASDALVAVNTCQQDANTCGSSCK